MNIFLYICTIKKYYYEKNILTDSLLLPLCLDSR